MMAFLVHTAKKLSWFGLGGHAPPLAPPPGSATAKCIGKKLNFLSEGVISAGNFH